MEQKYVLTDETRILANGRIAHRIRAVRDIIAGGKKIASDGELGGWVERTGNLSHDGTAWVYGDALVCGNARVYGDAWVYDNAQVSGTAWVYDNTQVSGNAHVSGNARVSGGALVRDNE